MTKDRVFAITNLSLIEHSQKIFVAFLYLKQASRKETREYVSRLRTCVYDVAGSRRSGLSRDVKVKTIQNKNIQYRSDFIRFR